MTPSKRYIYACADCDGKVTKPPTAMSPDGESFVHGLHGWECANCGPGIKVTRKITGTINVK